MFVGPRGRRVRTEKWSSKKFLHPRDVPAVMKRGEPGQEAVRVRSAVLLLLWRGWKGEERWNKARLWAPARERQNVAAEQRLSGSEDPGALTELVQVSGFILRRRKKPDVRLPHAAEERMQAELHQSLKFWHFFKTTAYLRGVENDV